METHKKKFQKLKHNVHDFQLITTSMAFVEAEVSSEFRIWNSELGTSSEFRISKTILGTSSEFRFWKKVKYFISCFSLYLLD